MLTDRPHPLPHRRCGDPVRPRHLRHLPQPEEHHRHPDVGRADAARRQHQLVAFSTVLHDLVGPGVRLFVLTVAAAEAAIGLAILVVYFRNRGTIAVEDINLMKGWGSVMSAAVVSCRSSGRPRRLLAFVRRRAAAGDRDARSSSPAARCWPRWWRRSSSSIDVVVQATRHRRAGHLDRRRGLRGRLGAEGRHADRGDDARRSPSSRRWCTSIRSATCPRSQHPRFMAYLNLFTFFMLMLVTGRQPAADVLRLGRRRPRLLPADRLLVRPAERQRRGDQGLHRQPRRRLRLHARHLRRSSSCSAPSISTRSSPPPAPSRRRRWSSVSSRCAHLICLLLFVGAMGKSAQIGLHTWLPDAMEGPTPGLGPDPRGDDGHRRRLHGRAHVAAVRVLAVRRSRSSPSSAPSPRFFAATIGCVQNDIKRVIAYSTCSQLGYMFFASASPPTPPASSI